MRIIRREISDKEKGFIIEFKSRRIPISWEEGLEFFTFTNWDYSDCEVKE